jgi:hypothetical protein
LNFKEKIKSVKKGEKIIGYELLIERKRKVKFQIALCHFLSSIKNCSACVKKEKRLEFNKNILNLFLSKSDERNISSSINVLNK